MCPNGIDCPASSWRAGRSWCSSIYHALSGINLTVASQQCRVTGEQVSETASQSCNNMHQSRRLLHKCHVAGQTKGELAGVVLKHQLLFAMS